MQVYVVQGGFDYEGYEGSSLQLFDCKSAAEAYAKDLKEGGFDYVDFRSMEVCMQSALAA